MGLHLYQTLGQLVTLAQEISTNVQMSKFTPHCV